MLWAALCFFYAYRLHDNPTFGSEDKYWAVFWLVLGIGFVCRAAVHGLNRSD